MRSLVESLKRLYKSGKVSAEKIKGMKILAEEEKMVALRRKYIKSKIVYYDRLATGDEKGFEEIKTELEGLSKLL